MGMKCDEIRVKLRIQCSTGGCSRPNDAYLYLRACSLPRIQIRTLSGSRSPMSRSQEVAESAKNVHDMILANEWTTNARERDANETAFVLPGVVTARGDRPFRPVFCDTSWTVGVPDLQIYDTVWRY